MIDFKIHTELFKRLNTENGIDDYINKLNLVERVKMSRLIRDTYPIKDDSYISDYVLENFNVIENVEDTVLGQFIMLEQIVTGKTTFTQETDRDIEFVSLLLRPKNHKEFDNENNKDEIENRKKIMSCPVQDLYGVINNYLEKRDYVLFKQYSGVFYELNDNDDEEDDEEPKEDLTSENLFRNQWYWYSIVRNLAKEDVTRYGEIYMLKMSVVLPEMSFIAQSEKIERANNKRQQMLNKL
tara:strand:+ start:2282 stop:3001 length:720 start_codon:yes stop_codon:yes gene_type:complete